MTDLILYLVAAVALTYVAGIVLKRRFSSRARIYVFEAYESEDGELRPARHVRKYRLYHRLFDAKFMPRVTSLMSLVPFVANRTHVHSAILYARAYAWDKNRAIAVRSEVSNVECLYIPDYAGGIPNKNTVIRKEEIAALGGAENTYLFTEGSVFVLREGSMYIFFYYTMKT